MKKALLAVFLFALSCKPTDSINSFALAAASGTTEIGRSDFGFVFWCRTYQQTSLKRLTDTSLFAESPSVPEDCAVYRISDSLLLVVNQTLGNYFTLLQEVSDKKLLAYDAGPLVTSLTDLQPRIQPDLDLSVEKIAAIQGLLNTVINEPLKYYRLRKLRRVMRENDSALAVVIRGYEFMLDSALQGEVDQALANYKSFVYTRLYTWAATPVEKAYVNDRYLQFRQQMDKEREKIQVSVSLLSTFRRIHQLLALEDGKTMEAEVKRNMTLISSLYEKLVSLNR